MTNYTHGDNYGKALIQAIVLKNEIERLTEELAKEKAFLETAGSGKHTVALPGGPRSFTVSENNVYDQDVMKTALLPGQFMRVSVRKVDNKRVAALYPHIYAASKSRRGFKVSL